SDSSAFTPMQSPVPSWRGTCTAIEDASACPNEPSSWSRRLYHRFGGRIDRYQRPRSCCAYATKKSPESFLGLVPLRWRRRCHPKTRLPTGKADVHGTLRLGPFLESCARWTERGPR